MFMKACACVALSGCQIGNSCQDNAGKSLGHVYRKRISSVEKYFSGSPVKFCRHGLMEASLSRLKLAVTAASL